MFDVSIHVALVNNDSNSILFYLGYYERNVKPVL
jgi:hypothetical protein